MTQDPSKDQLTGKPLNGDESAFLAERVKEFSKNLTLARAEIAKDVWGQDKVIELTVACMVAGGHLLSVGAPGLAKTRLVSRVATVMGLDWKRVQFTSDLMPSDILGSEVLDIGENGKQEFRFNKGPVFTQFLMADEINRAGQRTQSALLEAMQERRVTIAGNRYVLQQPFTVMATQNPIEQEGTNPLPEAQLDRFLMRLDVDYPDLAAEKKVMINTTSTSSDLRALFEKSASGVDLTQAVDKDEDITLQAILGKNDLILMQKVAKRLPLSEKVVDAVMQIVRNARPSSPAASKLVQDHVSWGPGPRAVQAFALAAKARALMDNRLAPNVEDVLALIDPILEHRMALKFSAKHAGVQFQDIKKELTRSL